MAAGSDGALPRRSDDPADLLRYARMLRPFPIKALAGLLYHVEATSASIVRRLVELQIDPPREADAWASALWQLDAMLWELAEYADVARAGLPEMIDRADVEAARADTALRAIMAGLAARKPRECPSCGGHGGSASAGSCATCQGSGIDPADPQSPL